MRFFVLALILIVNSSAIASAACKPFGPTAGAEATLVNAVGNQGKSNPPASNPPWTFAEWRSAMRSQIRWQLEALNATNTDLLHFAFEKKQPLPPLLKGSVAWPEGPAFIPVKPATLWCLVAPADSVVFVRGFSHITTVFHVDRQNDVIYFADPWPESFLLPIAEVTPLGLVTDSPAFRNSRDKLLVQLTRKDFEKRVHSLYKIGSRSLPKRVLEIEPTAKQDPYVLLGFGLTFIQGTTFAGWFDLRYSMEAAVHLSNALKMAPSNQADLREFVATKLYLSKLLADALSNAMVSGRESSQQLALPGFDLAKLSSRLRQNSQLRLGVAYGTVKKYAKSRHYFLAALRENKHLITARVGLALAQWKLGKHRKAFSDAVRAQTMIAQARADLEQSRATMDKTNLIAVHLNLDLERRLGFLSERALNQVLIRQPGSGKFKAIIDLSDKIAGIHKATSLELLAAALEGGKSKQLRAEVARALGKNSDKAAATNMLRAAIACDQAWIVRQAGLTALTNIGEEARSAIPQALVGLLHPNFDVRKSAEIFLNRNDVQKEVKVVKAVGIADPNDLTDAILELTTEAEAVESGKPNFAARSLSLLARGICTPSFAPRARKVSFKLSRALQKSHAKLANLANKDAREVATEIETILSEWSTPGNR